MKRTCSIILILMIIANLSACGGKGNKGEENPNLGIWYAFSVTMNGETVAVEEIMDEEISVDLRSSGKFVMVWEGEREEGKWTFTDGYLVLHRDDGDFDGSIANGTLTLLNILDSGMDMDFRKEGTSNTASLPATNDGDEIDEVEELSELQEWWDGDWYGYWETHSETDDYEDFQGGRWECFGLIEMNTDDTGDIYLWDTEEDFAMASISVSEDGGAGNMGAAFSESGELWFGAEIERTDWIIDPSIYGYDDYMVIDGRYDDELGGGFNYIVYLRPWGVSWDENTEEERPLWYDTWYLSAYDKATMWEAIEDRDGHIHTAIGNMPAAEESASGGSGGSSGSVNADVSGVKGKIIDVGNITVLCPDGWTNFGIPDFMSDDKNATNPNGLELRKGSEGEGYQYMMPGMEIQYYEDGLGGDPTNYYSGKSEDWGPIEIGGRTWQGFIGVDQGEATIWARAHSEYSLISMRLMIEAEGVKISLDDADVQAIINSVNIK